MNKCPYCGKNIPSYTKYCPECKEKLPAWNRILDRFGGTIPDCFQAVRKMFGEKESIILDVISYLIVLAYVMIVMFATAAPFALARMFLTGQGGLANFIMTDIYMMFVIYFAVGVYVWISSVICANRKK
ncbi:MAG: zinc ribbon domain-containing protein [Erysipelotrichaceae bacterium]|nr:zinc ribbon domain-containing protein [Erysipelotrichaceae bacterium]